jgi:hypothetical protein
VEERHTISGCTRRRQRLASRRRTCSRTSARPIGSGAVGGTAPDPVVHWEHRVAGAAAVTALASLLLVVIGAR